MNILILTNSYAPVLGGLQTVVQNLAVDLARRGHAVEVVTNRYPRSLPAREDLDGIRITRLLFLKPSFHFSKQGRFDLFLASFWFYKVGRLWLARRTARFRPDTVNVHYPLSQIPFVLALRRRRSFRLVVSLHGDELLPHVREKRDNALLRELLRDADAVTACSTWLLEP